MNARGQAILLAAACFATACGPARRSEPLMGPVQFSEAGERGRVVYMEYCNQCHPGGEAGLGPALNDKALPTFLKKFQVRQGLGSMPSFSDAEISDEELDDLMTYLEDLRSHEGTPGT
ncbi:MAG TPA: cytochrome c [Gemmatimonadota bacterium]|nr:cytochrome c [Gemmatimonadota bacterium]